MIHAFLSVAFDVVAFLPVLALYGIVVAVVVRKRWPRLLERIPEAIWMLLLAILIGMMEQWGAVRFGLVNVMGVDGPAINLAASRATEFVTVLVVMLSGASQVRGGLHAVVGRCRLLVLPATIGATGVLIGSCLSLVACWYLLIRVLDFPTEWQIVWRGAVANANGWIGDSTTLYPTLAIVDDTGKLGVGPPTILIDTVYGLAWFTYLVWYTEKRRHLSPVSPVQANNDSAVHGSDDSASSAVGKILLWCAFLGVALGGTVFLRVLAEVAGAKTWRAPVAVLTYFGLFGLAVGLVFKYRRIASVRVTKKARAIVMLCVVGMVGIRFGWDASIQSIKDVPVVLTCLAVIGLGAFVGHLLALEMFARRYEYDRGLVAVASMCAIGGLSTAPIVAGKYSEDYVEPSYFVALWCNMFSVVCLIEGWLISML